MKAHVEHDFMADSFRVWFIQKLGTREDSQAQLLVPGREYGVFEEIDVKVVQPTPSLVLPRDALEALIAIAGDVLPPSAATDRHLKDALAIRDRLLSLVERGVKPA